MTEKKTLLKKYGIPLHHLDFDYIKECNDAREMERIVHILQSGEEGYFPDLTKCAEDKLRTLKPNSRLFRCEERILRGDDVDSSEVKPIYEFSNKVRERDQRLAALKNYEEILPPLRTTGSIKLGNNNNENVNVGGSKMESTSGGANKNSVRIKSTDYNKWDKYDPEEEILRMDLEEERQQEEVERKNRLNAKKPRQSPLITEIKEEEERIRKLTDVERENLAEEHRLRGNEYFRAKEFNLALNEYTRGIAINPDKEVAIYNNRAITYIKLKKYPDAIKDCEKCLSMDSNNTKAVHRLAEANFQMGCKQRALELFTKLLEIDPDNMNAKNTFNSLKSEIGELPPPTATRLRIQEEPRSEKKSTKSNLDNVTKNSDTEEKPRISEKSKTAKDYDLASLVRPKEIIPNKLINATANLLAQNKTPQNVDHKPSAPIDVSRSNMETKDEEIKIHLPMMNHRTGNKKRDRPLIEEL